MAEKATEKARVAVFLSGAGTNMAALLYASRLADCPYEIVLVASNDPDAAGLSWAEAEGIATFALAHTGLTRADHEVALEAAACEAGADHIALAGYMRVLTPPMVARWAGRMLNIHPSLLPRHPGLHTHARALAAGDSHGGASVHLVTDDLDAGAVLGQLQVAILPGDTPEALARRVTVAEHQLYPRVLADYVARGNDPVRLLARLSTLALALPETHARESHGSPGFRVGSEKTGKFFAYFNDRHHGTPHIALLVKTSGMDELETLVEAQPDAYFKPAYYGASGWVGVILNRRDLDWDMVREWLERSWRAVAPPRLTKLMDVADRF
jgi:phosphoribosylglycinamide formyltransferase-1